MEPIPVDEDVGVLLPPGGTHIVERVSKRNLAAVLLIGLAAGLVPSPCFAYDVMYQVVDLGVLTPGGTSAGVAISNTDQVAGYGLNLATNLIAATTDASGRLVSIGTLNSGRTSTALGISPGGGVVIGESEIQVKSNPNIYATHAFMSTGPGSLVDLQDPSINSRFPNSVATGINNAGRIVGYVQTDDRQTTIGFLTDSPGTMMLFGTLGGHNSQANGVNSTGMVVGTSDTASGVSHAFITASGITLTDLGGTGSSTGNAINDLNHVVGGIGPSGSSGGGHAFFSTGPNAFVDLGVLSGTDSSVALGINNKDEIVGSSSTSSTGLSNAFIVFNPTQTNPMINLNSLIDSNSGWVLNTASGINAQGNITGTGTFQGQSRAFLLVAIPEPSIAILATLGLTCLLALRKLIVGGPASTVDDL